MNEWRRSIARRGVGFECNVFLDIIVFLANCVHLVIFKIFIYLQTVKFFPPTLPALLIYTLDGRCAAGIRKGGRVRMAYR